MALKHLLIPLTASFVLIGPEPTARAGCICPDHETVRVGDLDVANATVVKQTWTVSSNRVELELELSGASARTAIDLLAAAVPASQGMPLADPDVTAEVAGTELAVSQSKRVAGGEQRARATWKLAPSMRGSVTVDIAWNFPPAGADELPARGDRIAEFCIDRGTRKALRRADGFLRVDLALSDDMATGLVLRVARESMPVSLCARDVAKRSPRLFEIKGREKLDDKAGVLPILFGAHI